MTMEKLYRIEELCTSGWELASEQDVKLTKEQAKLKLEFYLAEGKNPQLLRAVPDYES
jgi:hypothetical protein